MASQLLHFLLKKVDVHVFPDPITISTDVVDSGLSLVRSNAESPRASEANFLADLVARLPTGNPTGLISAVSVAQYLNLLDRVLEDRRIDKSEAESLHSFATEMNLSLDKVAGLHASYVANLCSVARQDGVVTDFERNDLQLVSSLLNVSDWEPLLEMNAPTLNQTIDSPMLAPGLAVCFTGEMTVPREILEERSRNLKLVIKAGVSKKVDILVVADADSMSTKARKARELGIRIISEAVYLQLLATGELPV
jgi:DNA polymerase-3 subunit epsilon